MVIVTAFSDPTKIGTGSVIVLEQYSMYFSLNAFLYDLDHKSEVNTYLIAEMGHIT